MQDMKLERLRPEQDTDWLPVGGLIWMQGGLPPRFKDRIEAGEEVFVGWMQAYYRKRGVSV